MRLLIDGYNLLHATDLFGAGDLAGTLRGSREALLGFLAARLTERERRWTVIVFDAKDAPAGLPERYSEEGIDVRFARGFPDADAMIEEILEGATGARELTVVSGDRRVQRAARSRGAKPVDSSGWFGELCRREPDASRRVSNKEPIGSSEEWVKAFSDPEKLAEIERQADAAPLPQTKRPAPPAPSQKSTSAKKPAKKKDPKKRRGEMRARKPSAGDQEQEKPFGAGILDPFPEGYGEDLLDRFPEAEDQKDGLRGKGNNRDDRHD